MFVPLGLSRGRSLLNPSAARLCVCTFSCRRALTLGRDTQLLPTLAASCLGLVPGQQEAKIVAQAAIDGFLEINLKNVGCGFAFGLTAEKRVRRAGQSTFAFGAEVPPVV